MNAVVQPQKIETIFDHNLTNEERDLLAISTDETEYSHIEGMSQHDITLELVYLFGIRNNQDMINKYIAKLDPDFVKTELKWDALMPLATD